MGGCGQRMALIAEAKAWICRFCQLDRIACFVRHFTVTHSNAGSIPYFCTIRYSELCRR